MSRSRWDERRPPRGRPLLLLLVRPGPLDWAKVGPMAELRPVQGSTTVPPFGPMKLSAS